MTDTQMSQDIHEIRSEVAALRSEVADLKAEVRVTKHSQANFAQQVIALSARFDKFEEKMGGKLDALSEKVGNINLQQSRGLGFFGGIAFMIGTVGALLIAIWRLAGGHG